jgi:hypothetical protein
MVYANIHTYYGKVISLHRNGKLNRLLAQKNNPSPSVLLGFSAPHPPLLQKKGKKTRNPLLTIHPHPKFVTNSCAYTCSDDPQIEKWDRPSPNLV